MKTEINSFIISKKTLMKLLDEWLEEDATTLKIEIYPIRIDEFHVMIWE